jgi:hypothetical protein
VCCLDFLVRSPGSNTILLRATISAATFRAVSLRNLPRAEALGYGLKPLRGKPDTHLLWKP